MATAKARFEFLVPIRALKQILILDTCNSEAALPIVAKAVSFRGLGQAEQKAMASLARTQGVHLLAASTRQQFAAEVKALGHGVLTYSLLSGLGASGAGSADTERRDGHRPLAAAVRQPSTSASRS